MQFSLNEKEVHEYLQGRYIEIASAAQSDGVKSLITYPYQNRFVVRHNDEMAYDGACVLTAVSIYNDIRV